MIAGNFQLRVDQIITCESSPKRVEFLNESELVLGYSSASVEFRNLKSNSCTKIQMQMMSLMDLSIGNLIGSRDLVCGDLDGNIAVVHDTSFTLSRTKLDYPICGIACSAKMVLVFDSDGNLNALDPFLEDLWSFRVSPPNPPSACICQIQYKEQEALLIFYGRFGSILLLDGSLDCGIIADYTVQTAICGRFMNNLSQQNDQIMIGCEDGCIYSITPDFQTKLYSIIDFTITKMLPYNPSGNQSSTESQDYLLVIGHFCSVKVLYESKVFYIDQDHL
jgi:hypothetical protein